MTHLLGLAACLKLLMMTASSRGEAIHISHSHRECWSPSLGWIIWEDQSEPDRASLVLSPVGGGFLIGHIWSENAGWILLGAGPANGATYANLTGADHGVNVDAYSGRLSGFAWGENLGWINFFGGSADAPLVQLNAVTRRIHGYAWSECCGWLNFDDAAHFVAFEQSACPGDLTGDDLVNSADLAPLLGVWGPSSPFAAADLNRDGMVSSPDLALLLGGWGACPASRTTEPE